MTQDSLWIVLFIVIPNTKATIIMMIYKSTSIMALSPTISSPVKLIAWFKYLGTKFSSETFLVIVSIRSSDTSFSSISSEGLWS